MKLRGIGEAVLAGYNLKNIRMASCFCVAAMAVALPATAGEKPVRLSTTVKASPKSGKLVRTTVLSKPAGSKQAPAEVEALVQDAAAAHDVDPLLVKSVIAVESNYHPAAVSPKGAMGLMQLMPGTARRFGAENAFDARQNIEAGVKYLKYLKGMFPDDRLALAAYNAGVGAVMKYGGIPPYRETKDYVEKVGKRYGEALQQRVPVPDAATGSAEPPLRSVELVTGEDGRVHLRTRD